LHLRTKSDIVIIQMKATGRAFLWCCLLCCRESYFCVLCIKNLSVTTKTIELNFNSSLLCCAKWFLVSILWMTEILKCGHGNKSYRNTNWNTKSRIDQGLTLETAAFNFSTVANLPYLIFINSVGKSKVFVFLFPTDATPQFL